MKRADTPKYATEAEMCAQFSGYAEMVGWVPYPETAGWDILLVRKTDGYQIGVQAKLQANIDVLSQAISHDRYREGPDYKAVLVPAYAGKTHQLQDFCPYIGTTLIRAAGPGIVSAHGAIRLGYGSTNAFLPDLPNERDDMTWRNDNWFELCPSQRCRLPEYVPDVAAGASAPIQLTAWKIKAIKIAILLERRGFVIKADFKHIGLDHRRWISAGPNSWLVPDPPRGFVQHPKSTPGMGYKAEHPRNYGEIAADYDKWAPPPAQQLKALGLL